MLFLSKHPETKYKIFLKIDLFYQSIKVNEKKTHHKKLNVARSKYAAFRNSCAYFDERVSRKEKGDEKSAKIVKRSFNTSRFTFTNFA